MREWKGEGWRDRERDIEKEREKKGIEKERGIYRERMRESFRPASL